MSITNGPTSPAGAIIAAQTSNTVCAPSGALNTTNWDPTARDTYYANGGK